MKRFYNHSTMVDLRGLKNWSVEKVPVLVVVGVTETGHRTVLALQAGNKESASVWRGLFKNIKRRGLVPPRFGWE